ncbi:hypothetical protein ACSBR1_023814 [Camellia fascicularis]
MALTIITTTLFFLIFLLSKLPSSTAQEQPWIQAGYWFSGSGFPISDINSALFTHLICAFAGLNSSTYELSISSSDSQLFSNFTNTVKQKNPSIKTLLSIGGGLANGNGTFPIASINKNLNWVHVMAFDYYMPKSWNQTGAQAALYDPGSEKSTDFGINSWINKGLSANKLVLGLPFYGYAWTLVNPKDSAIGAPAKGPAINIDGAMSYKDIKGYIQTYRGVSQYNTTYVVNYCTIGSSWIGFDDVEVVKTKVAYAKKKNLLGYFVWQIPQDDNWVLSQAAQEDRKITINNKGRLLLVILLTATAIIILILSSTMWYLRKRVLRCIGLADEQKESQSKLRTTMASIENTNVPQVFSFTDIVVATNNFSNENKLGEGGYGPVYKGNLQNGQEIAVKRLAKTSTQGFEEFENEVMVTAKLQHVNLLRVLGYCTEGEEQMLIYEYMPNKSLDNYIYDPIRCTLLDWERRVQIIEGITQGLLYLQEYSRLTIIHRDLKASNILLDNEMKAKIADFGMARIFQKDKFEANTDRIAGTLGYLPPEYVYQGIYSTKSDVYSFGVLLLQIISGKRSNRLHGPHESLNLQEYAFELWKEGKGMEFMDPSLDDTYSSCKLMGCMQIALLCVQENPVDRPPMLELSSMLKNESTSIDIPKRPAFSTRRDEDEEKLAFFVGILFLKQEDNNIFFKFKTSHLISSHRNSGSDTQGGKSFLLSASSLASLS